MINVTFKRHHTHSHAYTLTLISRPYPWKALTFHNFSTTPFFFFSLLFLRWFNGVAKNINLPFTHAIDRTLKILDRYLAHHHKHTYMHVPMQDGWLTGWQACRQTASPKNQKNYQRFDHLFYAAEMLVS